MILKPQVAPILPRQAQDERCELTEGIIDRAEFLAGCIAIAGVAREQRGAHSLQRRHPSDPRHSEQVGATACSVWSFGIYKLDDLPRQARDRQACKERSKKSERRFAHSHEPIPWLQEDLEALGLAGAFLFLLQSSCLCLSRACLGK
jgi:hypothetical protein